MARIKENEEEHLIEVPREPIFDPDEKPIEEPMPVEAPEREREKVPA